jgi:glycosyltransferase involved in cell wall biosynthesis
MIYVGSLKYSPVYKSHCCAFGKACEEEGYSVKYFFSREYAWMLPREVMDNTVFVGHSVGIPSMLKDWLNLKNSGMIGRAFSEANPTHVYLHNYHFLNHSVAKICRKYGCKFIYHAHEPYVKNKSAHGGLQQYWLYLNEYAEGRLLQDTDVAVLSSKEASRLFDMKYPMFRGKKVEIPLMYEDLGANTANINERKYITFVGPPLPAKGPEVFCKIVEYSAKNGLDWSFLLISRVKLSNSWINSKSNLKAFFKERISDEEFGNIIKKSLVVLTPYRRETQSSVILVSYMYGTPVVSSNVGGLPEFVRHGKTGYLVDKEAPVEEWIKGIDYVLENFGRVSENCRNYFVENFSGKNWKKYLTELLA